MRLAPLIASALLLQACTSPQITANEAGGIANHNAFNQDAAFAQADAHCRMYGKRARINQVSDQEYVYRFTFDCVNP